MGVTFYASGARERDNVVIVRVPGNLFNPSCVKVGLSRTGMYTFLGVFRGHSHVYYKSVRDSARKSSVNAVYFAYYTIIT